MCVVTLWRTTGIDESRDFSSADDASSITCDRHGACDLPASHCCRARHATTGGVLSLYTGLGLLDEAFAEVGYTVDSAGDLQWGRPIQRYRGRIRSHEGIIAGVPCQSWSCADPCRVSKRLVDFSASSDHAGVVTCREFLRVVNEVRPLWWLVECVPGVPDLQARGYAVQRLNLTDVECGGTQRRLRSIQFGSRISDDGVVEIIRPRRLLGRRASEPAVLASRSRGDETLFERRCRAMGMAEIPDLSAFTKAARFRLVGNAVPLTMGRVLARAVTERSPITEFDCICGCGQECAPNSRYSAASNAACRKRYTRREKERFVVSLKAGDA